MRWIVANHDRFPFELRLYDAQNDKIYIGTIMDTPDESFTTPKIFMGTALL